MDDRNNKASLPLQGQRDDYRTLAVPLTGHGDKSPRQNRGSSNEVRPEVWGRGYIQGLLSLLWDLGLGLVSAVDFLA